MKHDFISSMDVAREGIYSSEIWITFREFDYLVKLRVSIANALSRFLFTLKQTTLFCIPSR
jgi:hypothetical protein